MLRASHPTPPTPALPLRPSPLPSPCPSPPRALPCTYVLVRGSRAPGPCTTCPRRIRRAMLHRSSTARSCRCTARRRRRRTPTQACASTQAQTAAAPECSAPSPTTTSTSLRVFPPHARCCCAPQLIAGPPSLLPSLSCPLSLSIPPSLPPSLLPSLSLSLALSPALSPPSLSLSLSPSPPANAAARALPRCRPLPRRTPLPDEENTDATMGRLAALQAPAAVRAVDGGGREGEGEGAARIDTDANADADAVLPGLLLGGIGALDAVRAAASVTKRYAEAARTHIPHSASHRPCSTPLAPSFALACAGSSCSAWSSRATSSPRGLSRRGTRAWCGSMSRSPTAPTRRCSACLQPRTRSSTAAAARAPSSSTAAPACRARQPSLSVRLSSRAFSGSLHWHHRVGLTGHGACRTPRRALVGPAYLMWKYGHSLKDALRIVRQRRPITQPNTGYALWLARGTGNDAY